MNTIRKASLPDARLLTDIGSQSFIESHGSSASETDIESYISRTYTIKKLKNELNHPANIFHIIYYND